MAICHIIYKILQNDVLFFKLTKGFEMLIIIKNAESLLQRFENTVETWAEKVF